MLICQYKAQSGHCVLEEVSQSSKISVSPMSVNNFLDHSLDALISSVLFKSCRERLLVRVILELLNQLFDCFSAIRVMLLDCKMRYAWYSVVDVAGLRMFLLLDQVDPVVHFANSVSA